MKRPTLSPRDRRALFFGACILVPSLLWTLAVAPYLDAVADARDRLATERGLLRREMQLLASGSGYPAAFDSGAARLLGAAPRLMGGADERAATATLAGSLRRLSTMGGANLTRVEPAAAFDAGGGVRGLPVGVAGESDLEGLLTLLQLLESGPKLVHVRELRLEAANAPVPMGAAYAAAPYYAASAGPEVLTFRFTATAFTLATDSAAERESGAELRVAEARTP